MSGFGEEGPFTLLPPAAAAALESAGRRTRRPTGDHLFFEADPSTEVFFVMGGSVKVTTVSAAGQEVVLSVLGQGDILGELSALDGQPRSATASALTDVELLVISRHQFWEAADQHPAIPQMLYRELAERVRSASQRQLEFGTADAMTRVCRRLVEMADRYGMRQADGSIDVQSPLTQTDLGAWAGLSRDAVVKALRGLRELGWIENRGNRLRLHAATEMRDRARFGG